MDKPTTFVPKPTPEAPSRGGDRFRPPEKRTVKGPSNVGLQGMMIGTLSIREWEPDEEEILDGLGVGQADGPN